MCNSIFPSSKSSGSSLFPDDVHDLRIIQAHNQNPLARMAIPAVLHLTNSYLQSKLARGQLNPNWADLSIPRLPGAHSGDPNIPPILHPFELHRPSPACSVLWPAQVPRGTPQLEVTWGMAHVPVGFLTLAFLREAAQQWQKTDLS